MKTIVALFALVAVAVAVPVQNPEANAIVLKNNNDNLGLGNYRYEYETSNGIAANEEGELTNAGSEAESIAVRGNFQYVGPDGVTYSVGYIADDNGFRPYGAHLPVGPA